MSRAEGPVSCDVRGSAQATALRVQESENPWMVGDVCLSATDDMLTEFLSGGKRQHGADQ